MAAPFVNVTLPVSAPEMLMEIDVTVPPAILNWGHNAAADASSVGPETVLQLTISVAAEAAPLKAVDATRSINDRVREFLDMWVFTLARVYCSSVQPYVRTPSSR